jgi:hypothetical protein
MCMVKIYTVYFISSLFASLTEIDESRSQSAEIKWFKLQLGCTYLSIRKYVHLFAIRNEINLNRRSRQNVTGEIINYHSQQRRYIVTTLQMRV